MATTSPDNIFYPDPGQPFDYTGHLGQLANSVQAAILNQIPTGFISMVAHPNAKPNEGWLWCDGSAISRSTYLNLFNAIGTTYGAGDGSTTFNVPNFNGRGPVGRDPSDSSFSNYGNTGGSKTHTLSVNEMPSHNHTASTNSAGNHNHGIGGLGRIVTTNRVTNFGHRTANTGTSGAAYSPAYAGDGSQSIGSENNTSNAGSHSHTVSVNNRGGGQAHNNMPPYLTVGFVIKT